MDLPSCSAGHMALLLCVLLNNGSFMYPEEHRRFGLYQGRERERVSEMAQRDARPSRAMWSGTRWLADSVPENRALSLTSSQQQRLRCGCMLYELGHCSSKERRKGSRE